MLKLGIAAPLALAPFAKYLDSRHRDGPIPSGLGGSPIVNLVEAMLRQGRQVVVFTLDRGIEREVVLEGEQIKFCIGPYRDSGRARDLFSAERAYLVRAIERERPDLVHAHWTYEFAMAALDSACPALVTAHDAPFKILRRRPDPYRVLRLCMAWKVVRRARHLTAVSSHVADHFRRYFRYRYPIHVVSNAVAAECFDLGRLRLSRPRSGPFTVAAALTGWKGLKNGPAALQAFGILRRSLPEARLLLFGHDYAPGGPADLWAQANSLASNLEFTGEVPNPTLLRRLATEVDVLLHPSLEESFGMAVAESMALGLAVVAGQTSGAVPEMLENGAAGVMVDVKSPRAIADALTRLAADSRTRQEMGRAAFKSACGRFRGEDVLAHYDPLYRNLCRVSSDSR